jgi:hypothetical protein
MAAHYLTRIANQGDITARVGEDRFALVTEGLVNKEQMQNMGVVLVAKTYRANDMLPPGVKLQFKVVVCLVDGRNVTAQHAFDRLVAQVQTVADGRNRPVQMIDL